MLDFLHIWTCFTRCAKSWFSFPHQAFRHSSSSSVVQSPTPQSYAGWEFVYFAFHSRSSSRKGHPADWRSFIFAVPSQSSAGCFVIHVLSLLFCSSQLAPVVFLPVTFSRSFRTQANSYTYKVSVVRYLTCLLRSFFSGLPNCGKPSHFLNSPTCNSHFSRAESINWFLRESSSHFPSLHYAFGPWGLPLHSLLYNKKAGACLRLRRRIYSYPLTPVFVRVSRCHRFYLATL